MRSRWLAVAGCVPLVFGLSACGDDDKDKSGGGGGSTVNVYSSLPLQGASKDQTNALANGIRLAFEEAGNKAGKFKIKYTSLDDSTAQAGNWDPGQTAQNARKAAQDKNIIAYIGEFNSGASAISIPILNQANVPQISPANTYVGLTKNEPGIEKGEPQKYYPTGKRTYVRIVPRDKIQSAALVTEMKADGCKTLAIANDKETYGAGLARLVVQTAGEQGLKIAANDGIEKTASNFRSYASKIKGQGADCFLFSGVTANGAAQINKDVAAAIPNAKLYGPDGICESGFTNPAKKGIPKELGAKFECTVPTLDLKAYPGGRKFIAAYKKKYGTGEPDPYAIYGYEAGQLVMDTIKKLGDKGNDKAEFLKELQNTKGRKSVLGTYSFDKDGDISIRDYGLFKVGPDGNPKYSKTIKAAS